VGNHEDGVSGWAGLVAGGGGVLALVCGGALAANQAGWQNGQP
jgi:1,4-dihydroxy-2-naphthoyl-CoA synthase